MNMQRRRQRYMKVSVIVPVYNVEDYLEECINSILNQTLKDIEIICVDDGSTDHSYDILMELQKKDNRLIVLKQKNEFAGRARNKGIEIAQGEYLVFLDSDDFFEKNLLERMYDACIRENADICVCDADNYDNAAKKYFDTGYYWRNALPLENPFSKKELGVNTFLFCYPMPWNKMFRKSLVDQYQLRFQKIRKTNDLGFVYLAIACAERITVVDEKLVHYRVGLSNSLQAKNKGMDKFFAEALIYLKEGLIERNLYQEVKASYNNLVMRTFVYEYKRQLRNEHLKMYEWFFKEGIPIFDIDAELLLPCNRKILGRYLSKAVNDKNGKLFRIHFCIQKFILKVTKRDMPYERIN